MSIFDPRMHRKSLKCFFHLLLPLLDKLHSVKYSAIHHSQKKNSFLSGYQSFPISLHLTRDVVEHTCCTHTTLYVFQLQINYKSISVFSDFTQDERNINSLAHENAYKPWLLPWEKATEKMFSWSNSLLIAVSNAPKSQLQWYSNKSLWLRLRLIFLDHEETKCSLPSWLTLEAKEIQAVS